MNAREPLVTGRGCRLRGAWPLRAETQAAERTRSVEGARRTYQAGLAYLLGGSGLIVFTVAGGLVPTWRQPRLFLLFPGLAFVVLFGLALLLAPRFWHRPRSVRITRKLMRVLVVTNGVRTLLFLLDAAGVNVHLVYDGRPAFFVVPSAPRPLFLVHALVAAFIVVMLVRALRAPN